MASSTDDAIRQPLGLRSARVNDDWLSTIKSGSAGIAEANRLYPRSSALRNHVAAALQSLRIAATRARVTAASARTGHDGMGSGLRREFVSRALLVYTVRPAVVLSVAPIVTGLATVGTTVWTFRYAARVRDRLPA